MTDMRDEIAAIVWLHKDYSEGYDAADAIMELVQARTDKLEKALGDFNPLKIGYGRSTDLRMLQDAWFNARDVLKGSDT